MSVRNKTLEFFRRTEIKELKARIEELEADNSRLRPALEDVLSDYVAYETCHGRPGRPLHDIGIVARARAALKDQT